MKQSLSRRLLLCALTAAAAVSLTLPASAFFWNKKEPETAVADFEKSGAYGQVLLFTREDFSVKEGISGKLAAITITTLPDTGAGALTLGGQPLSVGASVESSALEGIRFEAASAPDPQTASFTFAPTLTSGAAAADTTVTLRLTPKANNAPIARDVSLDTYKNVSATGWFDALDSDGDVLTFQLTSTPARGAVTLSEDGSGQFVYRPYENKTGKDSFTYVAIDGAGNTSPEATVSIRIDKAGTAVTYADLDGHPAHKAAIRLAEEEIFVGQCMEGRYFFQPDESVSRAEFLTMAMSVSGLEELEDVTSTGFQDDEAIPTWAKGSVSAALKAGVIRGSTNNAGAPVFDPDAPITLAEATVMLDQLLDISDVPAGAYLPGGASHWASQSAANLAACGVIHPQGAAGSRLSQGLTRAEAAQLLDGALDVMDSCEDGWLFG